MLKVEKEAIYKAFGFKIKSDISLPELLPINGQGDTIDIEIKIGNLSSFKSELLDNPYKHMVKKSKVMFYIPDVAFFLIQEGKKITVSPVKKADDGLIRIYILGTCMGALLMQRRILPLHGSAVAINGKAYIFTGDSGAGKSTLATAFLNQGYQLLSDDVIAISFSEDQLPFVTPAYPQQKLWRESLFEFGMESNQYHSIYGRETKYCIPIHKQYFAEPLPLSGIFELVKTENEEVEIHSIQGLERILTLSYHTYRNFLIPRLGVMDWHFTTSARIINHIDMYRLRRPVSGFTAYQLKALILDTIKSEGFIHN